MATRQWPAPAAGTDEPFPAQHRRHYPDNSISPADALIASQEQRYDYVVTNQTFGKKNSINFTNEDSEQKKEDLIYNR